MFKRLASIAFYRQQWPIALALMLLALSVVIPQVMVPRNTFHYVVTFDVTQSMNVRDVLLEEKPVSRLALARAATKLVMQKLPCGSKIGWSIFAQHRSFPLLTPLEVCRNYETLNATLETIDGRFRWRNASNVGKGVYWALRNSASVPDSNIIFITDGHESPPKREGQQLMPEFDGEPVGGWLIGVGSDLPGRIPKSDADGRVTGFWAAEDVVQQTGAAAQGSHEHLSELREPHLQALAKIAGLNYRRLQTADSLASAMLDKHLAQRVPTPTDVRWLPASLALALLAWTFLPWRHRRKRTDGTPGAAS